MTLKYSGDDRELFLVLIKAAQLRTLLHSLYKTMREAREKKQKISGGYVWYLTDSRGKC